MAVLNYTPQSGVLPVDQELTLANLAQRLSGPENALMTRGIGGILGMAQMARDYDYPDTALGLLSLPAKAVTGLGAAMMQAPAEMIDSANEQVAGLGDGSEVTEGALGMLGMGGVLGNMPKGALGANVFQGGPNRYGPEGAAKSLDHIGKGEGAQAYGWGRYDAENKSVADKYRKDLSYDQGVIYNDSPLGTRAALIDEIDADSPESVARLVSNYATPDGVTEEILMSARNMVDGNITRRAKELEILRNKGNDRAATLAAQKQEELARLEKIKQNVDRFSVSDFSTNQGYLYKHDLPDEDIARYMDWDAPLSEQPESVRAALSRNSMKRDSINSEIDAMDAAIKVEAGSVPVDLNDFNSLFVPPSQALNDLIARKIALQNELAGIPKDNYLESMAKSNPDMKAGDFYKMLERNAGRITGPDANRTKQQSNKAVAEALGSAGIPGLKYLDGMNRNIDNVTGQTLSVRGKQMGKDFNENEISATNRLLESDMDFEKARKTAAAMGQDGAVKLLDDWATTPDAINIVDQHTRNFVTWDQDVLNRMKLLERNGEKFSGLLAPNTITKSGASSDVLRKNGIWEISKISTPENMRGQGLASSELDRILKEADEAGVSVALTPSSDFGSSKKRLTNWYKRNGFVPNKGRNKDFSTRETMIRPAK